MIEKHILKNGIRIVAQKNKNSFAATVLVAVKTGSRNEIPEIHGISHFLEHMNFKGTPKRPTAFDITQEVDGMGAIINAYTGKEDTCYYIQAGKKHFSKSLEILSDMIFNSSLKEKEINKEKGTIIEEINLYKDTPTSLVPYLFEEILFENKQLAQDIIGSKKTIGSINSKAMREYRDKYYKAGNVVVSCAGNLPVDYVEKINKFFGNVSGKTGKYVRKNDNKLYEKKVLIKNKNTEQAHIYMGVETYDIKSSIKYAQDLLSVILGGNMSSRLFIDIREKRGLAYYIRAGSEANFDTGIFHVRAGLNVQKTEEAVKIIIEELERSKTNIKEEELKRAKSYIAGNLSLLEENSMNVAQEYALEEILGSEALPLTERIKLYEKVSIDEIQNVAKKIFKPENLKLAVIGPFKDEEKFVKILES